MHKLYSSNRERTDKNEEEITKSISYMIQFIDSARCMASSS